MEVNNIENKDEILSIRRSSSNPINKENNKIKGDETSLQSSSCSNLLEVNNTEDIEEIKSFESSSSSSHVSIENTSKEQNSKSSSLNPPVEFKQVLNPESIGQEASDSNESALPEVEASTPLTSLQREALKGCASDLNTQYIRSKSGSNNNWFERFNELPRTAGPLYELAVVIAPLQHAAGEERRGSQNPDHDPHPSLTLPIVAPVQQSALCEAVYGDSDEAEGCNNIQDCYEMLCCAEDDLFVRVILFACLGILFCIVSIFMMFLDPSLFPFALTFTILSASCFILFFINLVRCYRTWILVDES